MLKTRLVLIAASLAISAAQAVAQPQVQTLSKCLADNTSGKDRKELARWIFLAMATHPDIKEHAASSVGSASEANARAMGTMFTRLLAESCAKETQALVSAAGPSSIQYAFQTLGQLAMQELMADKSVSGQMGMFERFVDQKKLAEVLGAK